MATRTPRPTFANRALDDLKRRMDLPSDAALAEFLQVKPQMVSQMRSGTAPFPRKMLPKVLPKVVDKAAYALTRDGLLSLLPRPMAVSLRAYDNRRTARKTQVIEDRRLPKLFLEIDRALAHYAADDLIEAIEYYVAEHQ